jgi:hypothetical protein
MTNMTKKVKKPGRGRPRELEGRRAVLVYLDEKSGAALEAAEGGGVGKDRSATVRNLARAWAEDEAVRAAVAAWAVRRG